MLPLVTTPDFIPANRRLWPQPSMRARLRLSASGVLLMLLVLHGCSGPPPLSRAILPQHRADYDAALRGDPSHPGTAFLAWRAAQGSVPADEAARADAALSATRNPFDANHDRDAVSLGAVVYANHCARCHGENVDGRGPDVLPEHPCKDFHAFEKRFAVTLHRGAPRAWFAKIHDGHGPIVRYPGGPSTAMPPFGDALSREQIWLAVTYLQSLDMYVPAAGAAK